MILKEILSVYFTMLKKADFCYNTVILENVYAHFAKSVGLFYKFGENDKECLTGFSLP